MTAYEMRISYWSSDVCSSDLVVAGAPPRHRVCKRARSCCALASHNAEAQCHIRRPCPWLYGGRSGRPSTTDPSRPGSAPRRLRRLRNSGWWRRATVRSEEHTSELQSLMRISYAVFCLKKKKNTTKLEQTTTTRAKEQY